MLLGLSFWAQLHFFVISFCLIMLPLLQAGAVRLGLVYLVSLGRYNVPKD
ncbi:hypothetical protein RchiOBHm_Chr7g0179531 [Rosa chinensis]|uniref:Uncharacterized protein n=1 Tax=Rosa chinensis TaxID=74649 RepID=A0A2P6P256_ROSCH|nr:hypothetical protein RchiOBHm_Chr7g0179531 [Rosa chinensis]